MSIPISIVAEKAYKSLQNAPQLWALLERLIAADDTIDLHVKELASSDDGAVITNKAGQIHFVFNNLKKLTSKTDARLFFREVETLHKSLQSIFENMAEFGDVKNLIDDIDRTTEFFNQYVQMPEAAAASTLIASARKTYYSIKSFQIFLKFLIDNSVDDTPKKDELEFSFYIENTQDLNDFAKRLTALSSAYSELAQLLKVSPEPLRIAKVESGSLFTRLIGDTKIVSLMVDLLKGAALFYHRNYTIEGKFSLISPQVEAFDKVLELTKKLEEAGIDMRDSKEQLAKGVHSLSHSLNTLLADQHSVKINGETLPVNSFSNTSALDYFFKRRLTMDRDQRVEPKLLDNNPLLPPAS